MVRVISRASSAGDICLAPFDGVIRFERRVLTN